MNAPDLSAKANRQECVLDYEVSAFKLIVQSAWFVALVYLICVVVCFLLPVISPLSRLSFGDRSINENLAEILEILWFCVWFSVLPALLWASLLAAFYMRKVILSARMHMVLAGVVGLIGIGFAFLVVTIEFPFSRSPFDPRVDQLGIYAILVVGASLSLIVVFPLLSLLFIKCAQGLKINTLFARTRSSND